MSDKSDFLEDAILNHVLRNTAYTPATTVELALFTTLPGEDGTGGVEVSGGSYARQTVTFSAPVSNSVSNAGAVTFPQATASWGTVVGIGVYEDVGAGGNLLYYGSLTTSKVVDTGDQLSFSNGALTVSED
jgi:hypothetical protein